MAKAIDKIKEWAKENVQLISILPENKNLQVETRLRDILEEKVDEKYYLSDEKTVSLVEKLKDKKEPSESFNLDTKPEDAFRVYKDYHPTLQANDFKEPKRVVEVGPRMIGHVDINGNDICKRVYSAEGVSPTVPTGTSGNTTPKVAEEVRGCSTRTRAYVGQKEQLEVRKDLVSNTITSVAKDAMTLEIPQYRIRKLTPIECFRLQGFPDSAHEKAAEVNSNSQRYKQAGNSVTVNVIYEIAKQLDEKERTE